MSKRITFDAVSQRIVKDLFDGSPYAPRRKLSATKPRRKVDRQTRNIDPPKPKNPPKHFEAIGCPCCGKAVGVPDYDVLVDYYDIPTLEAAILDAVWRGKGMPVPTERIFDVMYADDPDGGPDAHKMYKAFKVGLCRLRARLKGSGVTIENVGYRRGYRLKLGEK